MGLMWLSEELNKFLVLNETTEGYLLGDKNNQKYILFVGCVEYAEKNI